jgi:hypothetical protein
MSQYSQSDLLNDLSKIFPDFAAFWQADIRDDESPSLSLHSVYMSFLPFLTRIHPTPKQWQLMANHFSEAVATGGDRENAADTCVLEHLHQVHLSQVLRPLLSEKAKSYVRA